METKICTKCLKEKPIAEFASKGAGKHQAWCKSCQNRYYKAWYRHNRQSHIAATKKRSAEYRERNRRFVFAYLDAHPCIDCGLTDPRLLEFDHVRGEKNTEVSKMVFWPSPVEAIMEEIAKCEVVCSNCHRLRTFSRAGGHPYEKLGLM